MELLGYSKREISMLTLAHAVALESASRQRVGAVVVKGGSVLAKATNRDHNDPAILEQDKVRDHASTCAERRALSMLTPAAAKGSIVYVNRAMRGTGAFGCSKPCSRCVKAMETLGVKKCVYIA